MSAREILCDTPTLRILTSWPRICEVAVLLNVASIGLDLLLPLFELVTWPGVSRAVFVS